MWVSFWNNIYIKRLSEFEFGRADRSMKNAIFWIISVYSKNILRILLKNRWLCSITLHYRNPSFVMSNNELAVEMNPHRIKVFDCCYHIFNANLIRRNQEKKSLFQTRTHTTHWQIIWRLLLKSREVIILSALLIKFQ